MAIQVPFPLPNKGFALNSKVRINFDEIVRKLNEFNDGTAYWTNISIGEPAITSGTLTLYNSTDATPTIITPILDGTVHGFRLNGGDDFICYFNSANAYLSYTKSLGLYSIYVDDGAGAYSTLTLQKTENKSNANFKIAPAAGVASLIFLNPSDPSHYITIQNPTLSGNYTLTLPTTDGDNLQVLQTNGSGVLSWVSQVDITGKYDKTGGPVSGNIDAEGGITLVDGQDITLEDDTGLQSVIVSAPAAVTSSYFFKFPAAQGAINTFLKNDGSGNMSWTTLSGAGGATIALDNLSSVAINLSLISDTDNIDDLGSDAIEWKDLWVHSIKHNDAVDTTLAIATTANNGPITITAHGTGTITLSNSTIFNSLTATTVPYLDASKALTSSTITPTELGYLSGVSSALQTQINGKASTDLSNLASVAVNTTISSDLDATDDLGSSTKRWLRTYSQYVKATYLEAGQSSSAGELYIYPATGSRGVLKFVAADNAGDTVTTITNASQAAVRTYTIPDAGASASFVMTAGTQTINGLKTFSDILTAATVNGTTITATTQLIGKGTATNDSAAAGYIGEYVESVITTQQAVGATGVWTNGTSISLSAGDWDVSAIIEAQANGATLTDYQIVISKYSGTTTTDHVYGDNYFDDLRAYGTGDYQILNVPNYRISVAATTTVYLKVWVAYSAGSPKLRTCKLFARRAR